MYAFNSHERRGYKRERIHFNLSYYWNIYTSNKDNIDSLFFILKPQKLELLMFPTQTEAQKKPQTSEGIILTFEALIVFHLKIKGADIKEQNRQSKSPVCCCATTTIINNLKTIAPFTTTTTAVINPFKLKKKNEK